MKNIFALIILTFIGHVGNAQIVTIPDANFKAKLLAANPNNTIASNNFANVTIDTNGNNEIEVNEADRKSVV